MQYGIFRIKTEQGSRGEWITSYTALQNLVKPGELLLIEAESLEAAAHAAADLLGVLRAITHSPFGNPDLVIRDFPDYYVGQVREDIADMYEDRSLAFRIETFFPVPQK